MNPRISQFNIRPAQFPEDKAHVERLFRDYQADIDVDLCFQSFEQELADLPGKYECILLATGGCVALRPYAPGIVELKRLFVYPQFRGQGQGRALVEAALDAAIQRGYQRVHLDTIEKKMPSAVSLYRALGFVEVSTPGGKDGPDLLDMELDLARFSPQKESTE